LQKSSNIFSPAIVLVAAERSDKVYYHAFSLSFFNNKQNKHRMKKLLLSLSLCSLIGSGAEAATVSGTVTSAATCAIVSGQKVYLMDTMMNYFDSTITNSSGGYSMTFPTGWSTPKNFAIAVPGCGSIWNTYGLYTGSNITINAISCGAAKTLNGTIMLGSSPNTGPAKVYLVKVQRNFPTAGDTTLTAIDSVTLTNSPNFSFKRACAPMSDTFLIKAALLPTHTSYSSWLPSYDSSLNWSTATRYYGTAWGSSPHYLFMFPGTNPGGPGFIGGSVLAGANKATAVGDPLPARLMILVNSATNAPVAYTYTDAVGKFSFPSVAIGTYKLFGDAWGMNNIPLTVSVTSTKLTVNNILFEENYGENSFKGSFTSRVGTVTGPLAAVGIYPNPATKQVSLTGLENIKGSKSVAIHNILGAVVMNSEFSDAQPVTLAVDALPAGTYILQLTTEVGTASFKLVK
jgi:hypothetical protein